jgi:secondary thiamine-phosphate synthase enzyme
MDELFIQTKHRKQVIDITEEIEKKLSGKDKGLCHLFIKHTTCALTTADLDPGTDKDMLDAYDAMFPKLGYRHPHNPAHVGDHIMSSLIGPEVTVPFENGKLVLGTWQRVVLIEFNGPRKREIMFNLIND